MGRSAFIFWAGEFVCVTAIAIILSLSNISVWFISLPVVIILVLKYFQYQVYVRERRFTLRQQLDLLDSILPHGDRDLRCTYHIPEWRLFGKTQNLVQVIEYVPKGGGQGRKFSINKGIIGRVYQQGGSRVENFDSDAAFRTRMVNEYGYSAREMKERTADRRSYLCVPIRESASERVLGLLYFDSKVHNTFTLDKDNEIVRTIRCAVESIKRTLTA